MNHASRFPIYAALAALLFAAAPASHAARSSSSLYKSIIKNSEDGDGRDIYTMIQKWLAKHPQPNSSKFVSDLIKKLKKNRDQLAFDVTDKALDRVSKKLHDYIKRHPFVVASQPPKSGAVTPPESPVVNP